MRKFNSILRFLSVTGVLKTSDTDIYKMLPPESRFRSSERTAKKMSGIKFFLACLENFYV
jgi:hypothetical protein